MAIKEIVVSKLDSAAAKKASARLGMSLGYGSKLSAKDIKASGVQFKVKNGKLVVRNQYTSDAIDEGLANRAGTSIKELVQYLTENGAGPIKAPKRVKPTSMYD